MAEEHDWFLRFIAAIERGFKLEKRHGQLIRPRHPRVIAGVCSGIAEYFGWDLQILRTAVVILTVFSTGLFLLLYAAAWVLIPEGQYALPGSAGTKV